MFEEALHQATAETTPSTESVPQPTQEKPESPVERNWKAMRERAEAAERRAQELEQRVQSTVVEEEEFNFGLDDESLAEGKHVKKAYKSLKSELQQTKKQLEQFNSMSAEMRLRSKFSDFDKVMTAENMQKLAATKPSLARSIAANPDLYDKGETAYDAIKSWIATESFPEQEKKLEENKNKPKSAASLGGQVAETPLTRLDDYDRRILTPERKEQLMRQVQQAKQFRS